MFTLFNNPHKQDVRKLLTALDYTITLTVFLTEIAVAVDKLKLTTILWKTPQNSASKLELQATSTSNLPLFSYLNSPRQKSSLCDCQVFQTQADPFNATG